MLNDTVITLQGRVGGDVALRRAAQTPVASFRVACTPRRFRPSSGDWADGVTQWYTVTAWRGLAEHCATSLRRGDPVVVHGRVSARTYVNKAGVEVLTHEVEALLVGHDLTWGTSAFTRVDRSAPGPDRVTGGESTPAGSAPGPDTGERRSADHAPTEVEPVVAA